MKSIRTKLLVLISSGALALQLGSCAPLTAITDLLGGLLPVA
jgi:hypothetical protein